jgi:polyketide cyclase/dehydrase/lipid transport protein
MKKKITFIILLMIASCCISSIAEAQLFPTDEQKLKRGEVIVSFKEVPDASYSIVQGEIVFDAPLDLVWEVLTDYYVYEKIFPDIDGVEVLEIKGNSSRVKIMVRNLWPLPPTEYVLVFKEDKKNLAINWIMEGKNPGHQSGSGILKFFGEETNQIKCTYSMSYTPGFFLTRLSRDLESRSLIIERLVALRAEIRHRKKLLEKNGDTSVQPNWKKVIFWWEKPEGPPQEDPETDKEKPTGSDTKKKEK